MELLGRLRSNAVENRDRNVHTLNDLKAWMAVTIGASSFKAGTNLWNKTQHGLVPPVNCGKYLSHDKWRKITRHLSQATPLLEGVSSRDRWRDVTWMIKAYNKRRKDVIVPGWLTCVDESMVGWTGNGMPYLSYTPRKPEPLGCEIKNTCDATTGCMLFLEIQAFILLSLRFRFATIAWPAFVSVSFVMREESNLFVLFTYNKTTSHECRPSFFFGFILNPFLRDSFCHCALTLPVPPCLCQDNKTMMARKKQVLFSHHHCLSCSVTQSTHHPLTYSHLSPFPKDADNNILPQLRPR
jgi:hypothetical protein